MFDPPFCGLLIKQLEAREIGIPLVRSTHPQYKRNSLPRRQHSIQLFYSSDGRSNSYSEEEEEEENHAQNLHPISFLSDSEETVEEIPDLVSMTSSEEIENRIPELVFLRNLEIEREEEEKEDENKATRRNVNKIVKTESNQNKTTQMKSTNSEIEKKQSPNLKREDMDYVSSNSEENVLPAKKKVKLDHITDDYKETMDVGNDAFHTLDDNECINSDEIELKRKQGKDDSSADCKMKDVESSLEDSEISEATFSLYNQFRFVKNSFSPFSFREQISSHNCFAKRLEKHKKLQAHTGCVNTINWSEDGNYLISGGDDTTVAIWDYDRGNICRQRIHTGHIANIFSAKFLPNGLNDYIITCARDGKVMAFNIEYGPVLPHEEAIRPITGIPLLDCTCHQSEVKRLTVDKDNPMVFQSCGEDGRVFLYDIRQNHTCNAEDSKIVLVDCPNLEIYSMDVNPINSNEFIIAGTNQYISLYDKR